MPFIPPSTNPGEIDPQKEINLAAKRDPMMAVTKPTPQEEAMLQKLGIKPGERIPKNTADKIQQLGGAEAIQEHTNELVEFLASEAADEQARQDEADSLPEQPAEGAADALRQIRSGNVPRIDISNDLDLDQEDEDNTSRTGAAAPLASCPRCGHDLNAADTVKVTVDDKRTYLTSELGGKPFMKTYELMGGALQVTFRTLSVTEIDAIYRQCYYEGLRGDLKSQAATVEQVTRYRVMLSIARLIVSGQPIPMPATIKEWGFVPTADNTEIAEIAKKVYGAGSFLQSESMYRILMRLLLDFQRLVAKLEENVYNSDFWNATE